MEVDPSSRGTKMNELVKEIPHVLIEVKGIELEVNTKIVDWKWSIMERHLPPLPHYSKINLRLIYLLIEEEFEKSKQTAEKSKQIAEKVNKQLKKVNK